MNNPEEINYKKNKKRSSSSSKSSEKEGLESDSDGCAAELHNEYQKIDMMLRHKSLNNQ